MPSEEYVTAVAENLVYGQPGLVSIDDQMRPYADLVTDVPTLDNGGAVMVGDGADQHLETTFHLRQDIKFSDDDVVNAGDYIPAGEINPHRVRPFLLHDHGFAVAVVFASCLQYALDEAADAGRLDRYAVNEADLGDYGEEEEGIARLGNAGELFDIEGLDAVELPNPPYSFVALFNAEGG